MMKQRIAHILRQAHLIGAADQLRMYGQATSGMWRRREFEKKHPDFPIPSISVTYDAFGTLDPYAYRRGGQRDATIMSRLIQRHHPSAADICDWGCGPARVLRHLPDHFPNGRRFFGLDYNPRTIKWCSKNFPNLNFKLNSLAPPLPMDDSALDALYCISVFTHLSESLHFAYIADIRRVLRTNGIMIATTHGESFRGKLLESEKAAFDNDGVVVRDKMTEGKRSFTAFHNPRYLREKSFAEFEIVEHMTPSRDNSFGQDIWVIRKH